MRVRNGRRMKARSHKAGEVGHVHPEKGTNLVGNSAKGRKVELARIR